MKQSTSLVPAVLRKIEQAVCSVRYGMVQITIHDGRVVQLDKLEKERLTALSVDLTSGNQHTVSPSDRISGDKRPESSRL